MQLVLQKIRAKQLGLTEAGIRLIHCVRLIWGPLNTGFTVFDNRFCPQRKTTSI